MCSVALDPEQEWCLRCGAAARTRLAASPAWKAPVIALAVEHYNRMLRILDKGIPVILGEYGASTKKEPASVRLYMLSIAEKVYGMGMCPMLWDPGSHFNRHSLQFDDSDLLKGFQKIPGMKRD